MWTAVSQEVHCHVVFLNLAKGCQILFRNDPLNCIVRTFIQMYINNNKSGSGIKVTVSWLQTQPKCKHILCKNDSFMY